MHSLHIAHTICAFVTQVYRCRVQSTVHPIMPVAANGRLPAADEAAVIARDAANRWLGKNHCMLRMLKFANAMAAVEKARLILIIACSQLWMRMASYDAWCLPECCCPYRQ